jgi:hypothetical protein
MGTVKDVFSRRLVLHTSLGAVLALTVSVVLSAGTPTRAPIARIAAARPVSLGVTPRVVVIGESLVDQVAGMTTVALRENGFEPEIRSRNSETVTSDFVQDEVRRAAASKVPIVVIETASNDAYQAQPIADKIGWPATADQYRSNLSNTLALLAHQCVVVIDTRDSATAAWYHLAQAGPPVNAAIRQVAKDDPNPVVVVPWSEVSRPHDADWFWADGLHFGDPAHGDRDWHQDGANAFTDAIVTGVKTCSVRMGAR